MKATVVNCQVVSIPVADGGEGSVECFLQALGGQPIVVQVRGPLTDRMDAVYGLLEFGDTAVIEMAACAGLPLVEGYEDPLGATTYGVGEMILDAARNSARKIIVGLGGSATNDGGCGAAAAIGIRFYDEMDNEFMPTGGTLRKIARIDASQKNPSLNGVEIIAMCDIDNPMYGPSGAAYVFGPQKGATPNMVHDIDVGLKHLASVIRRDIGMQVDDIPGSGAAGAMGAGMLAFFQARLQMGIETILDTVNFDEVIKGADLILTGEGKIDGQSLCGKVVIGVARRAKESCVPVVAIVGAIDDGIESAYDEGVNAIFSINRAAVDFEKSRFHSKSNTALMVDNLMRFCRGMGI